MQKETRYINEVQRLQTECSAANNEVHMKEKLIKKLQEKWTGAGEDLRNLEDTLEVCRQEK